MADDRIDVEVADKVSPNVEKKLKGIAAAARSGHSAVAKLKAELASINSSAASKLQAAVSSNANATLRQSSSNRRVAADADRAAAAIQKEAAQMERLSAVAERAVQRAAQARREAAAYTPNLGGQAGSRATAARATDIMRQTTVPAMPTAPIQAAAGANRDLARAMREVVAGAKAQALAEQEAARAASDLAARASALRGTIDPLHNAQERYNNEIREANTLLRANAITEAEHATAVRNSTTSLRQAQRGYGMLGNQAYQARNRLLTLQYTAQDVAASLASGANPLMILMQQGGQVTAAFGGVRQAITGVLRAIITSPIAIAIAAIAAALFALNRASNQAVKAADLTRGLGLTRQEIRQLTDVTVTFGDTAKAVFQVAGRAIMDEFGTPIMFVWNLFKIVISAIWNFVKTHVNFMIGAFVGAYRLIVRTWRLLPAALYDIMASVANAVISTVEQMINRVIEKIQFVTSIADAASEFLGTGTIFGQLTRADLSGYRLQLTGAARELGTAFVEEMGGAMQTDYIGNFADQVSEQAIANARQRLRGQANEIIENRSGGNRRQRESEAERRARELANVNRELDNEIRLMGIVGPVRERQARFQAIENSLIEKRIRLTQPEREQIQGKIAEIQRLGVVQQQLDRIYEEAHGPMRDFNATQEAATALLRDNIITITQYQRVMGLARIALEDTLNPLNQYTRDIDRQTDALRLYGRELEIETEALRRFDEIRSRTGVAPAMDDMRRQARELQGRSETHETLSPLVEQATASETFLRNVRAMYAEIERLRQTDVLSERQAAIVRQQVNEMELRARLANTTNILGQLVGLQESTSKELRAIGKAAAIVQATIDGYLAVQKALASAPPPFNFVLAAIVGAAAAANVAAIAGFERGGYTGSRGTKEIAGVVHGKEFVVNAGATARNRELLEAINRGVDVRAGFARGGYAGSAQSFSDTRVHNVRGGDTFEYHIDARGADAGVPERIEEILEAHETRVVARAKHEIRQDSVSGRRRQSIGGVP